MAAKKKPKKTKMRPEYHEGESDSLTSHWRDLSLDILAETSNVSEVARVANINPRRAYKIRREEPEFARQWCDALLEGYGRLIRVEPSPSLRPRLKVPKFAQASCSRFRCALPKTDWTLTPLPFLLVRPLRSR